MSVNDWRQVSGPTAEPSWGLTEHRGDRALDPSHPSD